MGIYSSPPYEEVLDFLSTNRFVVQGLPEWKISKNAPDTYEMSFGLLDDKTLERSKFIVDLYIQYSPKTNKRIFKFTLLKVEYRGRGGSRYYQLDIKRFDKINKNIGHSLPHEHIGRNPEGRIEGSIDWLDWDFTESFDYFCSRVNIDFDEKPSDPEKFILKE